MDNGKSYSFINGNANNEELENYSKCFKENGTDKDIKSLKWLHQDNLLSTSTIWYAFFENKIAAIYTAIPVLFKINNRNEKALQSIDTITDINHRGKGLFPKLANGLYDGALNQGFKLVYGFPNENSAPGFFNKLGWISFGEVPFIVKPLSIEYVIKKILKLLPKENNFPENHLYSIPDSIRIDNTSQIKILKGFGADYDRIWGKLSEDIDVCINRSATYMNWRYIQKPDSNYSIYGYFHNNQLKGVVVFKITNKHGGRIGYLMELIFEKNHPEIGKALLKISTKIFKKEKVNAALAWSLAHCFNYETFLKSGYYNLPVKLRPQHLFFGVKPLTESNASTIANLKNWYISYSDSDTV